MPSCIEFLITSYLTLLESGGYIGYNYENTCCLFQAFSSISLQAFLQEYDELNNFFENGYFTFFTLILFSPFEDPSFSKGNKWLVWYEKFSLLVFLNYCSYMNKYQKHYNLAKIDFKVPSLTMSKTLKEDPEFCDRIQEIIEEDLSHLLEILSCRDPKTLEVFISSYA